MSDYFKSGYLAYELGTGLTLKNVSSPFPPELSKEEGIRLQETPGRFGADAPSYMMRMLYGCRMAHPLIAVPVQRLSCNFTKWTAECDRRMHRLFCYLYTVRDEVLTGSLCETDVKTFTITAWPDADLAGDSMTTKSTSGFFEEIAGEDGRGIPLSWGCKRQSASSNHTCEAETASLSSALRTEVIPVQCFFEHVLGRAVPAVLMEDNAAAIASCEKGYSPAMRYLMRHHRISLGFIKECIDRPATSIHGGIKIVKADTNIHKGDSFTKELTPAKFENAKKLMRYSTLGACRGAGTLSIASTKPKL
jgi:hypothetical protein